MTTTKPASELEVVAHAKPDGSDAMTTARLETARVHSGLPGKKIAAQYTEPLVRQSDAEARIAALTAERDAAVAEVARLRAVALRLSRAHRASETNDREWIVSREDVLAARAALHPTQAAPQGETD